MGLFWLVVGASGVRMYRRQRGILRQITYTLMIRGGMGKWRSRSVQRELRCCYDIYCCWLISNVEELQTWISWYIVLLFVHSLTPCTRYEYFPCVASVLYVMHLLLIVSVTCGLPIFMFPSCVACVLAHALLSQLAEQLNTAFNSIVIAIIRTSLDTEVYKIMYPNTK
jgi:hypothetical protein